MKKMVTVAVHKGYEVKTLDGAEMEDEMDYIIEPELEEGKTYPTVEAAFEAIDNHSLSWRSVRGKVFENESFKVN
ncbi:hypothetical protein P4H42_06805 [Paenibacillus macerans]|uniref:hypothetical protein n=1 Tax=Paenibacillus macerans TaxID=44252 RepID=UPI002DB56926|nr:hypothetical protein [Paenibacillus macerans]MEC0329333.1 hypothetical protein [Paenibacillus macerans]